MEDITMAQTPYFQGSTQFLLEETDIPNRFTVSVLIVHHRNLDSIYIALQDKPLSVSSVLPNIQSQSPYSLFPEIPMGAFSTQVPYDATQGMVQGPYLLLQHVPNSLNILPRTAIASFDNSVRDCTVYSPSNPLY